jgi:hypothetical protein
MGSYPGILDNIPIDTIPTVVKPVTKFLLCLRRVLIRLGKWPIVPLFNVIGDRNGIGGSGTNRQRGTALIFGLGAFGVRLAFVESH